MKSITGARGEYAKCRRNYSLKRLATWLEKRGPPQTVDVCVIGMAATSKGAGQREPRQYRRKIHPLLFHASVQRDKSGSFPFFAAAKCAEESYSLCVCVCVCVCV